MESMQTKKGKYIKSLCMCFKTVVDEEDNFKPLRRRNRNTTIVTDPVLAYLAAADVDGVVLLSRAAMEECGNRRNGGRDKWYSFKMAFKETSLMKRIHSRRKTKNDSTSRSNTNATFDALRTTQQLNPNIINNHKPTRRTTSDTSLYITNSSAIFSSSPSQCSTTSSNSDNVSNTCSRETNIISKSSKRNIVEDKRKRNIALCTLWILSLFVLIFWGKILAILCTSIWFYIVPSRQRRKCKEDASLCKESDFDYVLCKKKIFMEGKIERSHSHASVLTCAMS